MNVEKTAGDKASYQESDPLSGKTVDSAALLKVE